MTQYGWAHAPAEVRAQVDRLARGLSEIFGADLVGVYLHGSLVFGCFNPERSDVDLLAVTRRRATAPRRDRLARLLLRCSGPKAWPREPPYPVEISVVTEADLEPWAHPTPFDFHYSENRRAALEREPAEWEVACGRGEDADLAAHLTVIRRAGVVLEGAPIAATIPDVPHRDYADSLLRDLAWCREIPWKFHSVLSASRIWATLAGGALHSKETGARWALERVPDEARPLIARALAVYRAETDDAELDEDAANRYVELVQALVGE